MGVPQDARSLKISAAKGEATGKIAQWLRVIMTLSQGPELRPRTYVTSWASKEGLKVQLKGGQRRDGHWGLLASSLVEKMLASGTGRDLASKQYLERVTENTQCPLLASTHGHTSTHTCKHMCACTYRK